tara:strand:- start:248 stop:718 length:471 start_codon:yes stop_codon:yes gene_type:complete
MSNKNSNFVFLILLFLLQSCSGGTIGNFLESSFKNNESNQISQKNNSLKNNKNDSIFSKNKSKNNENQFKDNEIIEKTNSQIVIDKSITKKNIIGKPIKKNKDFNPKSYRIIVILKKVDPSFPIEKFSTVLRNSNINFEIEKIEIIPDLKVDNKSI